MGGLANTIIDVIKAALKPGRATSILVNELKKEFD